MLGDGADDEDAVSEGLSSVAASANPSSAAQALTPRVVLAERWSTHSLATFDQRHFRAVCALDGKPFTLVPADGQ